METAKQHNDKLTGEVWFGGRSYSNVTELRADLILMAANMKKPKTLSDYSNEELLKECKRRGLL